MKLTKFFSLFFAVLGIMLTIAAIGAAWTFRDAEPVLLAPSREAGEAVTELMEAICDEDYKTVEELLYGEPDLGLDRCPQDPVGQLLWDGYRDSLNYILVGECYATEQGLKQDVKISALDMTSVTENLGTRSLVLLGLRMEAAEDIFQIYDENFEYREDLVEDVLYEAAGAVLRENAIYREYSLSLTLIFREGRWQIVAEDVLLDAISGGISA